MWPMFHEAVAEGLMSPTAVMAWILWVVMSAGAPRRMSPVLPNVLSFDVGVVPKALGGTLPAMLLSLGWTSVQQWIITSGSV